MEGDESKCEKDWNLPETVMAIILLLAHKGKLLNDIQALSAVIADLKWNKKMEVGEFYITRDASGCCCGELIELLERLGIPLSAFDNIKLEEHSVRFCQERIIEYCRNWDIKEVTAIFRALGIESIEDFATLLFTI
jgi:hypothetical protein